MPLFSSLYKEYEVVVTTERVEHITDTSGKVREKIIALPKTIKFHNYLYATDNEQEIAILREDGCVKEITNDNPEDVKVCDNKQWITWAEAMEMGASPSTMKRWIAQNLLEIKQIGNSKRYNSYQLVNLIEEKK